MDQNRIEKYAKYSGVIGIMFEWLSLVLFFVRQPSYFDGNHTISYFATLPQTRYIFAICYVLAALSLWIFFRFHVSKHHETPVKIFTVSLLSFIAIALFPYDPENGISALIHNSVFLISAVTFMLGMYFVSKDVSKPSFRTISLTLVAASAVTFLVYLPYLIFRNGSFTLLLEAGWWLWLQLWVIWISYATAKHPTA